MKKRYWKNKVVLVTGGSGFLGSHVVDLLKTKKPKKIIIPRSNKVDLRKKELCYQATKNVDIVIHLAATVGGIGLNNQFPATLFYDNLLMGVQLMEAARQNRVAKFVAIGTICAYPKHTPVPFKETDLWQGYPDEINAPYGLAKKMLLVQAQAMRKQFGFNAIYLLPTNLYGPRDNFNLKTSHVIPALIRKFATAKQKKQNQVTVWGSGKPTREFLYVTDAAQAIIAAAEKYNKPDPVNLGSGVEISIKNLAKTIAELIGYSGKTIFDTTMPDGQPRRQTNTTKAQKEFNFTAQIPFARGLKQTVEWYLSHSHKLTK